ncbi:MAG: hypothetical protein KC431_18620, partial [Myxococcales bacterium]|nr:hypothetical protein [Myxococcales bacterium]
MPAQQQRRETVAVTALPVTAIGAAILTAAALVVVLMHAWLCDDAFITLRCVANLVEGRGPVFNAPWRVQAFTHPAWMLLLTPAWALTREPFFTTIGLSVLVTAGAIFLGARRCADWPGALLFVGALTCSRAFVEYSTSGLENPLTHLIVIAAAGLCVADPDRQDAGALARRLRNISLLVSLAFLSRPDAILLLAPLWVHVARTTRKAGLPWKAWIGAWLLGATPALAWELFSLIYYGALVPNTAVAKLGLGIDGRELILRGLGYLARSATRDPVTIALLGCALVVPW